MPHMRHEKKKKEWKQRKKETKDLQGEKLTQSKLSTHNYHIAGVLHSNICSSYRIDMHINVS